MTHYVYRLHAADGSLLYVGVTSQPDIRIRYHRRTKPWAAEIATWTVDGPFLRPEGYRLEEEAIKAEHPRYNQVRMVQTIQPAKRSPTKLLADAILQSGLRDYVQTRRDAGTSWRLISYDLLRDTDVDVSHESLRLWYRDEEWAKGRQR